MVYTTLREQWNKINNQIKIIVCTLYSQLNLNVKWRMRKDSEEILLDQTGVKLNCMDEIGMDERKHTGQRLVEWQNLPTDLRLAVSLEIPSGKSWIPGTFLSATDRSRHSRHMGINVTFKSIQGFSKDFKTGVQLLEKASMSNTLTIRPRPSSGVVQSEIPFPM